MTLVNLSETEADSDIEKRLVFAKGEEEVCRMKTQFGVRKCRLLYAG